MATNHLAPNHLSHLKVHSCWVLVNLKVGLSLAFELAPFFLLAVDFVPVFVQAVTLSPVLPLANAILSLLV